MRTLGPISLRLLALSCLCAPLAAQDLTFSFDWRSRSKAEAAGGVGAPLNEGRILRASTLLPTVGPQPAPLIAIDAASLGLSLAGSCGSQVAGQVTRAQVREVAQLKMKDLNASSVEAAMRMVEGTARSCGIRVVD